MRFSQTGKLKYLLKNITIINLLLFAGIGVIFTYAVLPLLNLRLTYTPPQQKQTHGSAGIKHQDFLPPSPADYTLIGEENLFHPERTIPPEKKVEPELPKPDFILYGTMISDDIAVAYLEDLKVPRTTPGRGKRQLAVKKGDTMSGFTLWEIQADRVVMVRGEENLMVHMMNKQKPKQRDAPTTASRQTPEQQPQQAQVTAAPPKTATAKDVPPRQDTVVRPPPRSAFEATVRDFFDRPNQ